MFYHDAPSGDVKVFGGVFPLTQVEELVLRLASGGECVCGCRHRCLAQQQQRQQQGQKDEQRRSRYSHRLTQSHRPAHIPRYLYQAASTGRCTYTGTHTVQHTQQHTSRDNEPGHNKGRALDCSPLAVSFHCCWEKKGILGSPISTFTYSTYSMLTGHQHVGNTQWYTNKQVT